MSEANGSVTKANMRLSLATGVAFVDFSTALTLTPYVNHRLEIADSTGKKIIGFIKAVGSGETLDSELLPNTAFSNTDDIYANNSSLASNAGGQSGNHLEVTATSDWGSGILVATTAAGNLVKLTVYTKNGTQGTNLIQISQQAAPYAVYFLEGASNANWTLRTGYGTSKDTGTSVVFFGGENTKTSLFDTASLKKVLTPSSTGVTIVSASGGSTYNWKSEESGFNRNDTSGYTYEIFSGKPRRKKRYLVRF